MIVQQRHDLPVGKVPDRPQVRHRKATRSMASFSSKPESPSQGVAKALRGRDRRHGRKFARRAVWWERRRFGRIYPHPEPLAPHPLPLSRVRARERPSRRVDHPFRRLRPRQRISSNPWWPSSATAAAWWTTPSTASAWKSAALRPPRRQALHGLRLLDQRQVPRPGVLLPDRPLAVAGLEVRHCPLEADSGNGSSTRLPPTLSAWTPACLVDGK